MKKLMIGAAVAALCCSAVVGYCMESGNVVGYQSYTLKKGMQQITVIFSDLPTGEGIKLGSVLVSAVEGDRISYDGKNAIAKKDKEGKLHWISKGKIVDDTTFPDSSVTFRYFRRVKQETTMTFCGQVNGSWLSETDDEVSES